MAEEGGDFDAAFDFVVDAVVLLGGDVDGEAGLEAGAVKGAGGGLEFADDDVEAGWGEGRTVEARLAGGGGADDEEAAGVLEGGEPGFEGAGGLAVDEGEDERGRGGVGVGGGGGGRGGKGGGAGRSPRALTGVEARPALARVAAKAAESGASAPT